MSVSRVEIKDLLVFKGEFTANFCPGVNVLIGKNGTGKTTLMKVLYWGCEFSNKSVLENGGILRLGVKEDLPFNTIFLLYCYFNQLITSKNSGNDYNSSIESSIKIYSDEIDSIHPVLDMSISKGLGSTQLHNIGTGCPQNVAFEKWCRLKVQSVFIPVTEMLSHSRGLLALNRERPLPFDYTEMDIISKAELEPTRHVTKNAKNVIDIISRIIEGEVTFDGKDFYIDRKDGDSIPFSFEASGFRKFGLLWKLIRNGLLEKDSILFWDEPENSLSPELVPVLVDILLELSRNGVQVFIATHDYNFARYFDVRKDKTIPVAYHNLIKVDGQVICNSSSEYIKLPDNHIEKASANLFKAVVSDAMEVRNDE